MKSYLAFVLLCLTIVRYTKACSLPKCKPGTQHCIAGNLGADCRGYRGCHKTCPRGSRPIGPPVLSQAMDPCPYKKRCYFGPLDIAICPGGHSCWYHKDECHMRCKKVLPSCKLQGQECNGGVHPKYGCCKGYECKGVSRPGGPGICRKE